MPLIAAAVLVALGGWMLWPKSEDEEEERARRLTSAGGLVLIGLGVSISLDELAIGFSLGLVRLPVVIAIPVIALQALVASQVGFVLGSRVGERLREGAEKLAGIALSVLLLAQRLAGSG
jgi:putative Mn2+ efflux pump MntP